MRSKLLKLDNYKLIIKIYNLKFYNKKILNYSLIVDNKLFKKNYRLLERAKRRSLFMLELNSYLKTRRYN